jgi:hypothetical protein
MRLLPVAALVLALTAACSGPPRLCLATAGTPGIRVDVTAELAKRVGDGTLVVCWAGTCRTGHLDFLPVTGSTCTGQACSTRLPQIGGRTAFVEVAGLPQIEVTVTVRLTDRSGATVVDKTLAVTPEMTHPNGPGCGGGSL